MSAALPFEAAYKWISNVSSSIGLIVVNKFMLAILPSPVTLSGLHAISTMTYSRLRIERNDVETRRASNLPRRQKMSFVVVAVVAIASLNLSLMLNEVGCYQLAKLLQVPTVLIFEKIFFSRRMSCKLIGAISTVVGGVAFATIHKFSANTLGSMMAVAATVSTGMQQILIADYQARYQITSTELLAEVSPLMGGVFLVMGPSLDFYITGTNLLNFVWTRQTAALVVTSCLLAVWVNVSAYICIGSFSALTFQVIGHVKTATIVFVGWLIFGDVVRTQQVAGLCIAMSGIFAYTRIKDDQDEL